MNKPKIYLSGSIEFAKDPDSWRKRMFKELRHQYNVIIPDPVECPFDKEDAEYMGWIKEHYIMPDMVDVATSQYFFVKLDSAVFKGAGTVSELTTACWLGKDIIVLLDKVELKDMPGWTIGCLANATFVNSIDEAITLYKEKAKHRK